MSRSKLERCIEILNILDNKGPASLSNIRNEVHFNNTILDEHLVFLIGQGLIEKHTMEKARIFVITKRGINVVNYFCDLKQPLATRDEIKSSYHTSIGAEHILKKVLRI
jgi:predicted transcriptional regulator